MLPVDSIDLRPSVITTDATHAGWTRVRATAVVVVKQVIVFGGTRPGS